MPLPKDGGYQSCGTRTHTNVYSESSDWLFLLNAGSELQNVLGGVLEWNRKERTTGRSTVRIFRTRVPTRVETESESRAGTICIRSSFLFFCVIQPSPS